MSKLERQLKEKLKNLTQSLTQSSQQIEKWKNTYHQISGRIEEIRDLLKLLRENEDDRTKNQGNENNTEDT